MIESFFMEGNLYQITRSKIEKKYQEVIREAQASMASELAALEKLRPYWEGIPASKNQPDLFKTETETSINGGQLIEDGSSTAVEDVLTFPEKVEIIVDEKFDYETDIHQGAIFQIMEKDYPWEIQEPLGNVRSRIAKKLD